MSTSRQSRRVEIELDAALPAALPTPELQSRVQIDTINLRTVDPAASGRSMRVARRDNSRYLAQMLEGRQLRAALTLRQLDAARDEVSFTACAPFGCERVDGNPPRGHRRTGAAAAQRLDRLLASVARDRAGRALIVHVVLGGESIERAIAAGSLAHLNFNSAQRMSVAASSILRNALEIIADEIDQATPPREQSAANNGDGPSRT